MKEGRWGVAVRSNERIGHDSALNFNHNLTTV